MIKIDWGNPDFNLDKWEMYTGKKDKRFKVKVREYNCWKFSTREHALKQINSDLNEMEGNNEMEDRLLMGWEILDADAEEIILLANELNERLRFDLIDKMENKLYFSDYDPDSESLFTPRLIISSNVIASDSTRNTIISRLRGRNIDLCNSDFDAILKIQRLLGKGK